jgi:hypothetical protein
MSGRTALQSQVGWGVIAFGLLATAAPAMAQWTRVEEVAASNTFSVRANGDTIAAGADTTVYVSSDAGATWKRSVKPVAGVTSVQAVLIRNGRLYAGTFGQGVFISDDLGDTWQAFNQGLVGGPLNSQLLISDFQVRGDSLYAATLGAGVYVRNLAAAGTWSHFGEEFEPNQASNVDALALGGTRLLAAAGSNGMVFRRDPGEGDWTISWLNNVGLSPGRQARSLAWNGSGWVVGTNTGVFRSVLGQEPWTPSGPGLGTLNSSAFATRGRQLFAAFDIVNFAVIEHSLDDGATWQELESLPAVFVFKLAMSGTDLYAARADGLWRRSTATVSVPGDGAPIGPRFAMVGPQPVRDFARFRVEMPEPGSASIAFFDVAGRRVADRIQQSWSAGTHELAWNVRDLVPGVYSALLTTDNGRAVVRLAHIR